MRKEIDIVIICVLCVLTNSLLCQERIDVYYTEIGIQGGGGYYVGDATRHIFKNVKEAYGGHFRYKFDRRWAIQVKGLYHHIGGKYTEELDHLYGTSNAGRTWKNNMINLDVCAEFNFFRLGFSIYDRRVKRYSPFIFLGFGMSLYGYAETSTSIGCYIPVGIGFKYNFARRWGINIAWQHNIYLRDNVEGIEIFNDAHKLNGSNIMNNDITSQFTFAIFVELIRRKKICRICDP